jgi:hypothetical protein
LRDGIMSADELARHYNLTDEEIAALSKPPPSRRSIDAELAAILKDMSEDRRAYFRDEKKQARHLELIELSAKLKAGPTPAAKEEASDQGEAPPLDPELLRQ